MYLRLFVAFSWYLKVYFNFTKIIDNEKIAIIVNYY